jgi:hypothetical protein
MPQLICANLPSSFSITASIGTISPREIRRKASGTFFMLGSGRPFSKYFHVEIMQMGVGVNNVGVIVTLGVTVGVCEGVTV